MTQERIDRAIEVIEYAIANNISVKAASVKCGFADTYVKNVKSSVLKLYNSGDLDQSEYDRFNDAYNQYLNTNNQDGERGKPNININVEGDFKEFGDTNVEENIGSNKSSYKEYGDTAEATFQSGDGIRSVDDLLDAMGVDRTLWEVKSKIVNSWDTTSFSGKHEKTPVTHTNYQVKARLEKIKAEADGRNVAEVFEDLIKEYKPPVVTAPIQPTTHHSTVENNLLEVSLFDLHIGKLGWAGEVGENFDTKIAASRFHDAISNLMHRAEGFDYSRILFPIGNDFFNSDNQFNTTSAGTPQDEDLRWQKTFKLGCQLIIDGINMLKASGVPVDVVVIAGNHDWERSYYLGTVVEAWFRNDEQVNVDNGASPRKYYQFGEVLLGLTHGKYEKENALPLLMATEQKELWGQTTFHEWHLGHFHKKRNVKFTVFDKAQVLNEELGVTVRYLSSLSGTEEWHFKKGFVGAHKAGEAFIWNDKSGMVGHLNFNFTDYDREH